MTQTYDGATTALQRKIAQLTVENENLEFRLSMATADPESQASQLLSKHNALRMASNNLDAQRQRIEELTAELETAKRVVDQVNANIAAERAVYEAEVARLRGEVEKECTMRDVLESERGGTQAALATERAAREQAEQLKEFHAECAASLDSRLQQAERERDTALARVKSTVEERYAEERAREAAETALASSQALVKELDLTLKVEREAHCDTAVQCEEWKELYAKNASLRHIAETALASAREILNGRFTFGQMVLRLRALLTSHPKPSSLASERSESPAPVATPSEDAQAAALIVGDDLSAHPGSGRRISSKPVAAPAPGLLERIEQVVHGWGPGTEYDTAADAMDAIAGIISYAREAPIAAPPVCDRCEGLTELCEEQDAKLRELHAKLDETRPVFDALTAAEQSNALLLRRLRFRNETIAFLTKSKLSFDENQNQVVSDGKRLRDHQKHIQFLQRTCGMLGNRLHVKRAEVAHWQDKAGWEDIAKYQGQRDGKEMVSLRLRLADAQDRIIKVSDDYDACHRQHEQCMKLLERCSFVLLPSPLRDWVRLMLSKGELPEGTL